MNHEQRRMVRLTVLGIIACTAVVVFYLWVIQNMGYSRGY
jgi:hypothetical protein